MSSHNDSQSAAERRSSPEASEPTRGKLVELTISTRHPEKWIIVDTDTRQVWRWSLDEGGWVGA